jgi:Type I restriction-modification system methyltransferase subunit
LSYFRTGEALARINYRDMDTEELGSVYESLLELSPEINAEGEPWRFGFTGDGEEAANTGRGSERKRTGSYYTPDSLVQELIKSALEPVIQEAIARHREDPRTALLEIKICDPACGSGHFLLAAARRLALEIARLDALTDTPDEPLRRHALREVVKHCIYGVDKNPLAVELCKAALWLETVEPGKPLGFLDHHIRCGDSLIGILDPKVLEQGIPTDAYKPLSGDDAEVAKALKKQNAAALKVLAKDRAKAGTTLELALDERCARGDLDAMPEDSIEQIAAKSAAWQDGETSCLASAECQQADLFVTAFFMPKTQETVDLVAITEDLHCLMRGVPSRAGVLETAQAKAREVQAFHWRLMFPEVFVRGGFDVVLGNPPWEQLQLDPQEFFSLSTPNIANARNMAARDKLIAALATENPLLSLKYWHALDLMEKTQAFIHDGKRFPLTSFGRINLAPLFAELFLGLVNKQGLTGIIVPSGIATDSFNQYFFAHISSGHLASLYDFENRNAIFPGVHRSYKFCLLTLGRSTSAQFIFFATQTEQLKDARRGFTLTPEEIRLLNPNTRTCPVFRSQQDAELTKKIYRHVPVLIEEEQRNTKGEVEQHERNPWGIKFVLMFMMNTDSYLFHNEAGSRLLPLYEAKMIHQFDHRWAAYEDNGTDSRDCRLEEKQRADYSPRPRYWVMEEEVILRITDNPPALIRAYREGDAKAVSQILTLWAAGQGAAENDGDFRGDTGRRIKRLYLDPTRHLLRLAGNAHVACKTALAMQTKFPLVGTEWTRWHFDDDNPDSDGPLRFAYELMQEQAPTWLMGWRDICRSTDERTVIASVVPRAGVGNNLPLMLFSPQPDKRVWAALLANLCALAFDFVARHKVGGTHLNYFIYKQLPVLPPARYTNVDLDFIARRVLELTYTAYDLKPWAEALGYKGAAFPWNPKRRALIRAELDAYYARLYGLTRDELRYILDPADVEGPDYPSETFRVLRDRELRELGEYRTKRLVLEAWDRLATG